MESAPTRIEKGGAMDETAEWVDSEVRKLVRLYLVWHTPS